MAAGGLADPWPDRAGREGDLIGGSLMERIDGSIDRGVSYLDIYRVPSRENVERLLHEILLRMTYEYEMQGKIVYVLCTSV